MHVRIVAVSFFGATLAACSSDSSSSPPADTGVDATIDCSKVGCAAPPPCGETCKEVCGCCVNPSCADTGTPDVGSDVSEGGTADSTTKKDASSSEVDFGDAPPHEGGGFIDAAGLCTSTERTKRLRDMVLGPITLPNHAGTLDLFGDGYGLTLGEAETKLCASADLGDQFGDGSKAAGFGDSLELMLDYNPVSGRGRWFSLWPGYIGALAAKSPDGAHTYSIPVNSQISKDGAAFTLNVGWDTKDASFLGAVDELYRAVAHTYFPSITLPAAGTTCFADKTCVIGNFGAIAYIFFKGEGLAIWTDDRNAADPVPSIPTRLDIDLVAP